MNGIKINVRVLFPTRDSAWANSHSVNLLLLESGIGMED